MNKLICDGCDDVHQCRDCPEASLIDYECITDDRCVMAHIARRVKSFLDAYLQEEGYRKLNDWRSVAEVLPEVSSTTELWVTDGVAVWKAFYTAPTIPRNADTQHSDPRFCFRYNDEYAASTMPITHWMPYYWIPAPPKTEVEQE